MPGWNRSLDQSLKETGDRAAAKAGSELAAAGSERILARWLSARPI